MLIVFLENLRSSNFAVGELGDPSATQSHLPSLIGSEKNNRLSMSATP